VCSSDLNHDESHEEEQSKVGQTIHGGSVPAHAPALELHRHGAAAAAATSGGREHATSPARYARRDGVRLAPRAGRGSNCVRELRGTAQNPMTRGEVEEKAYHLMAPVVGTRRARAACEAVWNIERIRDVRELRRLLQA